MPRGQSLSTAFSLKMNRIIIRFLEGLAQNGVDVSQEFVSCEELYQSELYQALEEKLRLEALAFAYEAPVISEKLEAAPVEEFVEFVPIALARRSEFVVIGIESGICLVTSSLPGALQMDNMRRVCRRHLSLRFASFQHVQDWINVVYESRKTTTDRILNSMQREGRKYPEVEFDEDLLDSDEASPVIHLVNSTLFDAVHQHASDVHLQPYEDRLVVRFRIDGVLFDRLSVPKSSQEEVLSRVKVIGKMNIAEKRMPQDGRVSVKVGSRRIDLRIASLPTSYGERIVIRLLDQSANLYSLAELGMQPGMLLAFHEMIHQEHGMILVTGPTGAGKSTTLYAALQELNTVEKNVVTLEDPIEYQLEGVSQTQINPLKGLTFVRGLRNVLRQDPDVIMVGEIRDEETAEMAIQSSLTGHLVFSTLHTNDAISSIARLIELGVESYLVAHSIAGILSQRLVRRVCHHCEEEILPHLQKPERLGRAWFMDSPRLKKGVGCVECRQTGYLGRVGIYELLILDDRLKELIQQNESSAAIQDYALQTRKLIPIKEDGQSKIRAGMTTVDEVARLVLEL